jgi:hypothetical protein
MILSGKSGTLSGIMVGSQLMVALPPWTFILASWWMCFVQRPSGPRSSSGPGSHDPEGC